MLFVNTVVGVIAMLALFYKKTEVYKLYSVSDKIFHSHNSRPVNVLFKTIFLFTFINLLAALAGAENYISRNNVTIPFYYILSGLNTIVFLIGGIISSGPTKILKSLCPIKPNKYLLPIAITVSLMNFISHFIITPIVLPTRLLINQMVGELMHREISQLKFGLPILIIINFLKIVIYIIQSYVFYLFSQEIYERLCKIK